MGCQRVMCAGMAVGPELDVAAAEQSSSDKQRQTVRSQPLLLMLSAGCRVSTALCNVESGSS